MKIIHLSHRTLTRLLLLPLIGLCAAFGHVIWIGTVTEPDPGARFAAKHPWTPGTVEDLVSEIETGFAAAAEALDEEGLMAAWHPFRQTMRTLEPWIARHGANRVNHAQTLSEWVDDLETSFRAKAQGQFVEKIALAETGEFPAETLSRIAGCYRQAGIDQLDAILDRERSRLTAVRAENAARWIRVEFTENVDGFGRRLMPLLQEKAGGLSEHLSIAHGTPMSVEEEDRTFKTIRVSVQCDSTPAGPVGSRTTRLASAVPTGPVTIRISVDGADGIPTSWDALPPIRVSIPVNPDTIDGARSFSRERLRDTRQAAVRAFLKLPDFRLFPDRARESKTLFTDGTLDVATFQFLALTDRTRLAREVNEFLGSSVDGADTGFGELAGLMIRHDLIEFGPWMNEFVATLSNPGRVPVLAELTRNPGYAGGSVLVALLKDPALDRANDRVLGALRAGLRHEWIREAVVDEVSRATTGVYDVWAPLLMECLSARDAAELARHWAVQGNSPLFVSSR